jgi:glucosamine--fructose-6-phosphate aminotransferase (isomerizing)
VISAKEPERIVVARNESPLVIGIGTDGVYCGSDVTALLSRTRTFMDLNNGEVATIEQGGAHVRRISDGVVVERPTFSVD